MKLEQFSNKQDLTSQAVDVSTRSETFQSSLIGKAISSATIAGLSVPMEEAIAEAARRWFSSTCASIDNNKSHSSNSTAFNRLITGLIQSVETTRAVVGFASLSGAVIDRGDSDSMFNHIRAVQRSGMTTASIGEVRFRSDCMLLLGDEACLKQTPLLIENLTRLSNDNSPDKVRTKRILALGRWSSEGLEQLRVNGSDVFAVSLETHTIPRMLHQLSRFPQDQLLRSPNTAARWFAESDYLSVVWDIAALGFKQSDLWTESLYGWMIKENARRRVVGLPISGSGMTFQQTCTWLTGFPGRIQLFEGNVAYNPDIFTTENYLRNVSNVVVLKVDESMPLTRERALDSQVVDHQSANRSKEFADILIAPSPDSSLSPNGVFIPCGIAGFESAASMFRADGAVSVHVASTSRVTLKSNSSAEAKTFETLRPMSAHEVISRLQIGLMNLRESQKEALA